VDGPLLEDEGLLHQFPGSYDMMSCKAMDENYLPRSGLNYLIIGAGELVCDHDSVAAAFSQRSDRQLVKISHATVA